MFKTTTKKGPFTESPKLKKNKFQESPTGPNFSHKLLYVEVFIVLHLSFNWTLVRDDFILFFILAQLPTPSSCTAWYRSSSSFRVHRPREQIFFLLWSTESVGARLCRKHGTVKHGNFDFLGCSFSENQSNDSD